MRDRWEDVEAAHGHALLLNELFKLSQVAYSSVVDYGVKLGQTVALASELRAIVRGRP